MGTLLLLTDDAYRAVGVVDVEAGRWVGRDTSGKKLFDRKDFDGVQQAAKRRGRLVSASWYGVDRPRSEKDASAPAVVRRRVADVVAGRMRGFTQDRVRPKAGQRWTRVWIDGEPIFDAMLDVQRGRWNGWECPLFPIDQAEQMRVEFDKVAKENPGALIDTLRWAADDPRVLEMVSGQLDVDGYELRPGKTPEVWRIEPDAQGLYDIGGYNYCWSEAPRDDDEDEDED